MFKRAVPIAAALFYFFFLLIQSPVSSLQSPVSNNLLGFPLPSAIFSRFIQLKNSMIVSMTGFGKASRLYKAKKITVEIRSLNSRYTEVNLKLPPEYKEKEISIRQLISNELVRGKVDCTLTVDYEEDASPNLVNTGLLKAYHKQLSEIAADLGIRSHDLIPAILRIPQVMTGEKEDMAADEWKILTQAINEAMTELMLFRREEGSNLYKDIEKRLELLGGHLETVKELEPKRAELKKNSLMNHLESLVSHIDGFTNVLKEADVISKGKKLNFFSQEMGREINTIGSKANHAGIQSVVVSMKDELEKIKEQLLNII